MSPAKRRKEFVVIGLGKFGLSVVERLVDEGQIVTAIDTDAKVIESIADKVSYSAVASGIDEGTLRDLGVANADHVIVSTGNDEKNPTTTILTVANLLDMNIPQITVKSDSSQQTKILRKLGITDIVLPEKEAGIRTAIRVSHEQLIDFMELDEEHAIVQFEIREPSLTNIPLNKLNIRERFNVNIIAIKREGKTIIPSAEQVILLKDILVVISHIDNITKFEDYLGGRN